MRTNFVAKVLKKFFAIPALHEDEESGSALLKVLFVGAAVTGASYTLQSTTNNQVRVSKNLLAK